MIQFFVPSATRINSEESPCKNEPSKDYGNELPDLNEKSTNSITMTTENEQPVQNYSLRNRTPRNLEKKEVSPDNRGWAEGDIPNNVFKGKKIVITGDLKLLGDRDPVAGLLKGLGARVTSSVSKNTDIVVMGEKPGPSKLEKVELLISEGVDIRLMNELELILALHDEGVDLLAFTRAIDY